MIDTDKREEMLKLINGKVTYDKFGGQYFWINDPDGGSQMLAEMRGWGHIQNMFKRPNSSIDLNAAAKFQDLVGDFIAEAINEKVQSLSSPPSDAIEDIAKAASLFFHNKYSVTGMVDMKLVEEDAASLYTIFKSYKQEGK